MASLNRGQQARLLILVLLNLLIILVGAFAAFIVFQAEHGTVLSATLLLAVVGLIAFNVRWGRSDRSVRLLQLKCGFSLGLVLLLLALVEGGARLAGFAAAPEHPRNLLWIGDAELGFACRPNTAFRFLAAHGWVSGGTDQDGFRPVQSGSDQPDSPVVICLGDSTTFSAEVADDDTWPEAAAQELARQGKGVRLLNRSVPGYSTLQSELVLAKTLQDSALASRVRGVVYLVCMNDPPELFDNRSLPRPVLRQDGAGFEVIPPEYRPGLLLPSSPLSWIKDHSALSAAFRQGRSPVSPAAYRLGALDVIQTIDYRFLKEPQMQAGMRFALARLQAVCAKYHVPLYVAMLPSPAWDEDGPSRQELNELTRLPPEEMQRKQDNYHQECEWVRQATAEVGARFIDLRGCLSGMTYRDYAASPFDWHFGPAANQRIGQAIARQLAPTLP